MLDSRDDRRADVVRRLVHGTLSFAEAVAAAREHGLSPAERYRVVRAKPTDAVSLHELARIVAATGGGNGRDALASVVDGEVIAVVRTAPRVPPHVVAGLGTPVPLSALNASFTLASRALETAIAYGIDGVVDIDELSLRPAILTEPHLGERLVDRYVQPLMKLGPFGDAILQTLHEYLASGMRIQPVAESLYIHPNTLRHRLERFEEITKADLRRTQDLLEVWWALERHRLDTELGRAR